MEELIEMYRKTSRVRNFQVDRNLLKRNNISESQWLCFLDLIEDLDLNEEGVRIMLDEISSGRVVLK